MTRHFLRTIIFLGLLAAVASGCGRLPENSESASQASQAACTGAFVPHALDFATTVRAEPIRMFDSNGAGVAVGDLDNDGFLDLYVVNGMAAQELFGHLPRNELVEQNQAFRNDGRRLVPAPQWRLDATAGGRGMTLADFDDDGDLGVVVNNLQAPAMIYENQRCTGAALEIDLSQPASQNTRAWGAQLTLHTNHGTLMRTVHAISGYASGDPARVHFGFPADSRLTGLDIRWPDGATSSVTQLAPSTRLTITRR